MFPLSSVQLPAVRLPASPALNECTLRIIVTRQTKCHRKMSLGVAVGVTCCHSLLSVRTKTALQMRCRLFSKLWLTAKAKCVIAPDTVPGV